MKFRRLILTLFLALALARLAQSSAGEPAQKADDPFAHLIGKKAPELVSAYGLNGRAVKLAQLRGKVVLLDFWAVWCGPCRAVFPHLNTWHREFRDEGLEVLGVTTYYQSLAFDKETGTLKSVGKKVENDKTGQIEVVGGLEPAEEHDMLRAFAAHHKLRYPIIMLTRENYVKSAKEFARRTIPQSVLIDRLGVIRMVTSGTSEEEFEALGEGIKKLIAER